jgi:hypothetical protein
MASAIRLVLHTAAFTLAAASVVSAQATVEGTVVNTITRAGIAGAVVRLYTQKGVHYETNTTGDGTFQITGVQEGSYQSSVEKSGFASLRQEAQPGPAAVTKVSGKDSFRLDLELLPITTLRGRVIDSDGKPASGVKVEIMGALPNSRGLWDDSVTLEDGTFAFKEILPGTFTLLAHPKPSVSQQIREGVRMEPVATYYPSALERTEGQPITVRGIGEESGYEIRLRSAPVHTVRGVVVDEAGKPAAHVQVQMAQPAQLAGAGLGRMMQGGPGGTTEFYLPSEFGFLWIDDGIRTDMEGKFEFPAVVQGEWIVRASSDWEFQERTKQDVQRVGETKAFVSRSDVEDLEIRLAGNFEFKATIEWPQDSQPPGQHWANMVLVPVEAVGPTFGQSKPDGTLLFDRVYPGRYLAISTGGSIPGVYVSALLLGGHDVLGQPFTLGPSPPPMRIVYKNGAGTVRGSTEKGAAATVVLIPEASLTMEVMRSREMTAGTGFEFSNLRPGEYSVVAFDRVDPAKLARPEFVPSLAAVAKRIKVEESAQLSVELPVNHWPD